MAGAGTAQRRTVPPRNLSLLIFPGKHTTIPAYAAGTALRFRCGWRSNRTG